MRPKMKMFRYQPINKNTLSNLSKGKNWIADPLLFNDPYEFRIRDIYEFNTEGENVCLDDDSIEIREHFLSELDKYGVISYSTDDVNQLLWSHYASNHTGMCLVFEVPQENEIFIRRVKYEDTLPKIEYKNEESLISKGLIEITTTKSKNWSYEKEFRQLFLVKNRHEEYPGKLVEIIFGCRCSIDDIELVFQILRPDNSGIVFSKTFIQKNTFLMGISSIPHVDNVKYEVPIMWKNIMEM